MAQLTYDDIQSVIGQTLVDADGSRVGTIEDIYLDQDTREPEWILVNSGLFGTKESFVPAVNASRTDAGMQVDYDKATIKDAPRAEPDGDLSQDEEAQLYRHYGLEYSEGTSDSGLPAGQAGDRPAGARDTSGPETDRAMTRSEEQLQIRKTKRPSETVRLRKFITSEQVSTTVPVEREVLRVEREAITEANIGDAMSGPDLSTEEVEIALSAEQVVVDKTVVPKERVRLDTDVEVEQQVVEETVRKEQIEVEGDMPVDEPRSRP